ncbi:MAG: deoxyribonuclease IV [candidate division WOR-3 bacterium]
MKLRYGFHFSIAGGLPLAIHRALRLGCNSIQIFTSNPRSLFGRELNEEEIREFVELKKIHDVLPVVVHVNYLINLASNRNFYRSFEALFCEYERAIRIGADYVVLHPGSTSSSRGEGIIRLAFTLNRLFEHYDTGPVILIENTPGGGSQIGSNFYDILDIIGATIESSRVGVCFDTAHAFQAGYPIHTLEGFYGLMEELERIGLLDKIMLVHFNDSKTDFGSHKDRHWHLGDGKIGKAMKTIMKFFVKMGVPFIMETPWGEEEDRKNLAMFIDWMK